MGRPIIPIVPLTRASFAPFGDVVMTDGASSPLTINQGYAQRVNGLAQIDVAASDGIVNVALFEAMPRPSPIVIAMMERHPIASQMFYPLQMRDWLVVVCSDPHAASSYRAFRATGRQGVNYLRNVWHHPLLVACAGDRFMVVDRGDRGDQRAHNLDEVWLAPEQQLELPADCLN